MEASVIKVSAETYLAAILLLSQCLDLHDLLPLGKALILEAVFSQSNYTTEDFMDMLPLWEFGS